MENIVAEVEGLIEALAKIQDSLSNSSEAIGEPKLPCLIENPCINLTLVDGRIMSICRKVILAVIDAPESAKTQNGANTILVVDKTMWPIDRTELECNISIQETVNQVHHLLQYGILPHDAGIGNRITATDLVNTPID
jgi:hypothetical protein